MRQVLYWDGDEEQGELLYVFLQDLDGVLGGLAINVITTGRVARTVVLHNEGNYRYCGPCSAGMDDGSVNVGQDRGNGG